MSFFFRYSPHFFLHSFLLIAINALLVIFWMYVFQVCFWEKISPKNFASLAVGISKSVCLRGLSHLSPFFCKNDNLCFHGIKAMYIPWLAILLALALLQLKLCLPQSPIFNPIELLWDEVDRRILKACPKPQRDFGNVLYE